MMRFKPCIPGGWQSLKIQYRYESSIYNIQYHQSAAETGKPIKVLLDGTLQPFESFSLVNDGASHEVIVRLGSGS